MNSFENDKFIHCFIDECISCFKKCIESKQADKNKVYLEILKRHKSVSEEIKKFASSNSLLQLPEDTSHSCNQFSDRAALLFERLVFEDILECALDASTDENLSISDDELHHFLYSYSMNPVPVFESNSLKSVPSISYFHKFSSNHLNFSFGAADEKSTLSQQMQLSQSQVEDDLQYFRTVLNRTDIFEIGDCIENKINPSLTTEAPLPSSNSMILLSKSFEGGKNNTDYWADLVNEMHETSCLDEDTKLCRSSKVPSWERKIKQQVAAHLYTTEMTPDEVAENITTEDPEIFRSLHDPSTLVSEADIVHDVLNLLIGIPTRTFYFDADKNKFQMKSYHLHCISHRCTRQFVNNFLESGSMYHRLDKFANEAIISSEGSLTNGLKEGIRKILSAYLEYIIAIRINHASVRRLQTDVAENSELINTLGIMLGFDNENTKSIQFPKGLGLLQMLHKSAILYKGEKSTIIAAVLLKYAYAPYLQFLNKWISEGICDDPFGEFHILEDVKYLSRKNELYWKFAYTEFEDHPAREIPVEIKRFSHSLLQCGKSMRLLQTCPTKLGNMEFLYHYPPPSLSLLFSYEAIHKKTSHCQSYLKFMNKHSKTLEKKSNFKEDEELISSQSSLELDDIITSVERKWNRLNVSQMRMNKETNSLKRCASLQDLQATNEDSGFSGSIYKKVGLLFSSCVFTRKPLSRCSTIVNISPLKPSDKFITDNHKEDGYINEFPCNKRNSKTQRNIENEFSSSSFHEFELTYDVLSNAFVSSLVSLLVSDYKDSREDIISYIQFTSLQNLLDNSFSAVTNMRFHLVQKCTAEYVFNQLKFKDLLKCFKSTYFLQNESFSQSLCESLFQWVYKCMTMQEYANLPTLNAILVEAFSIPSLSVFHSFLSSARVCLSDVPKKDVFEKNNFVQFFRFEFEVEWPLNIFFHKACIMQYSKVFSTILEMEFLCWLLGKMWRLLVIQAKNNKMEESPQYRNIMLKRFDMHQFVRILRNCIHQDIGGPLWDYLEANLSVEELSVDSLIGIHLQYLERALSRCFLTQETSALHELVSVIFQQIYRFCECCLDTTWEMSPVNHQYEIPAFEALSSLYDTYTNYKKAFYQLIMKMVIVKKDERSWDYQFSQFLEGIWETGRNM